MPSFILDTSAFINSWNHHYRLPVFQGVWDALGYALARGQVAAPSEVLAELADRAGDPLHRWAKAFDDAFVPPQPEWLAHIQVIQHHAPHWFAGTGQHGADPFVVAMAIWVVGMDSEVVGLGMVEELPDGSPDVQVPRTTTSAPTAAEPRHGIACMMLQS